MKNSTPRLTTIATSAALALTTISLSPVTAPVHAQACAGDNNGDGIVDGIDLAVVLGAWGTCPGIVTSVAPQHGSSLGGTLITITGSNLAETTGVSVGGVACTNLQVLSPTVVKAVTPAGALGEAAIAVASSGGTTLAPTPFTYVLQSITSISPNQGNYTGGTAITITGTYLSGATSVKIGGVPATSVVSVDATTVTAVTPAGSVGIASVEVTCAKGIVNATDGFTYFAGPTWATVLEYAPDAAVVTDATLRAGIIATGLPWRVRDNASNIEMLLVPPGTFTMGCSASLQYGCDADENPTHLVTLTNAFYLGRYEVTQAQWVAEMGSNPSYFVPANGYSSDTTKPVERVSWNSIQPFLTQNGLRLPTDAEWEYAYRAGTTTAFHNGSNDDTTLGTIAWYSSNSGNQTHAVGGKFANALGMHDMSGNVWEWVSDWYGSYSSDAATNPTGPSSGNYRVIRGGSWYYDSGLCRASYRGYFPGYADSGLGVRVARTP